MADVCVRLLMCSSLMVWALGQTIPSDVTDRIKAEVEARVASQMKKFRDDLLSTTLPDIIHSQVEASLTRILAERSKDAAGTTQMMSQLQHLKQGFQHMKRQMKSLTSHKKTVNKQRQHGPVRLQEQSEAQLCVTVNKTARHLVRLADNVTSINDQFSALTQRCNAESVERQRLKSTFDGLQTSMRRHRQQMFSQNNKINDMRTYLRSMNRTHSLDMIRATQAHKELNTKFDALDNDCMCLSASTSSTATAATTSSTTTPFTTSSRTLNSDERTRILVVHHLSKSLQRPRQINMQRNEIEAYPFLNISYVLSVAYEPVSQRVLFSRSKPEGIFSSDLDKAGVTRLRGSIRARGLTVDAGRQTLFFSTSRPIHAIGRMSPKGANFKIIVTLTATGFYYPIGIDVDCKHRVIYFCKYYEGLWSVTYDGRNLHRIKKGRNVNAVTFDTTRDFLYFNIRDRVMRRSLVSSVTTEVMQVDHEVSGMVYYNNSLYTSSYYGGAIDVIHLNTNERVTLKKTKNRSNVICLLP